VTAALTDQLLYPTSSSSSGSNNLNNSAAFTLTAYTVS